MQKAKVQRYVAGKRPKFAPESDDEDPVYSDNDRASSDEDSDHRDARSSRRIASHVVAPSASSDDRRLRRLMESDESSATTSKGASSSSRREIVEPVVLQGGGEDGGSRHRSKINLEIYDDEVKKELEVAGEESPDEEADEEERMRRRLELKQKALQRQQELLLEQDDKKSGSDEESDSEEESDEYEEEEEEYTDAEDEIAPRLKPVFVRKKDRVTIQEKEEEEQREKENEAERAKLREETKKHTRKMIEDVVSREKLSEKVTDDNIQCDFDTDDEKLGETDYEAWRLREVKRIKRDRDEKEAAEREKQEIQRIRNMTDEERAAYLKANPKHIANSVDKESKYKFLQKYYHRGAFFMDADEDVFKRDYAKPTLEDHFDKSILPKVMQVKNFGMSGRTKYTHLLDQDTTKDQENPWGAQDKFISGKGGGTKQVFDNPTAAKKRNK